MMVLTESTAFEIGTKAPPFKVSLLYWQHSNVQSIEPFSKRSVPCFQGNVGFFRVHLAQAIEAPGMHAAA